MPADKPSDFAAEQAVLRARQQAARERETSRHTEHAAHMERLLGSHWGVQQKVLERGGFESQPMSPPPPAKPATVKDVKGADMIVPHYITTGTTMLQACKFLTEQRVGLLLVCDAEGGLVGVLSERDIIKTIARIGGGCLNDPIDRFVTADVTTCASTDKVSDVARTMSEKHFRHVPIVDDGLLKGMISATDIVNHFAKSTAN